MWHRQAIHGYLFAFFSLALLLPCYPERVYGRRAVIDGLHPVGEQTGGDAGAVRAKCGRVESTVAIFCICCI